MAGEYTLSVIMKAQDSASSVIGSFMKTLGGINPILKGVGGAILGTGAAVVGFGVAATNMAANYQQQMTMIQSLTGSTSQQMNQYSQGVMKISNETGKGTMDISKGLYQVISAGYQGSDALKVLDIATRDSVVSMSDQKTTTTGLVVALNSYKLGAKDAGDVANQMHKTVSLGRMDMNGYAQALQTGAAAAHANGVSLQEMNATLATLTSGSVKTAGVAMTDLTQLTGVMNGKTDMLTKRIKAQGISFNEAAFKNMDYTQKVEYLNKALSGLSYGQKQQILGSKNAVQGLQILGDRSKMYRDDLSQLNDKQKLAADSQEAWTNTQNNWNFVTQKAKTSIDNFMLSFGLKLLPALTDAGKQIAPLIDKFTKWVEKNHIADKAAAALSTALTGLVNGIKITAKVIGTIITIISNVVGWFNKNQWAVDALKAVFAGLAAGILIFAATAIPALLAGFASWAVSAGIAAIATLAAAAPFILVGAVVAVAVFGIIMAVKHWGDISKWLGDVWHGAIQNIIDMLNALGIHVGKTTTQIQLDSAKQKEAQLKNSEETERKAVAHYEVMRTQILQKLKSCKDGAEKISLEHQLKVVDAHLKTKVKSLQHTEELRIQNRAKMVKLKEEADEQSKGLVQKVGDWFGHLFDVCKKWVTDLVDNFHKWLLNMVANAVKILYPWLEEAKKKFEEFKSNLIKIVTNLVNDVVTWFNNLKGNITKAIIDTIANFLMQADSWKQQAIQKASDLVDGIRNFFTNLPGEALQWGQNLIQNFINGINNMVGNVKNAASNIINTVKNFMGFHSPAKEGPGSDADTWAPNLMKMLAQGVRGGLPTIKAAVKEAAKLMKEGLTGQSNAMYAAVDKAQATLQYQGEQKRYDKFLQDQHKRYEKYLADKQKAYDKYESGRKHKKAFSYAAFKEGTFHAGARKALSMGAFAIKTTYSDPTMNSGQPLNPQSGGTVHYHVHQLTINAPHMDVKAIAKAVQEHDSKKYRMSGTHVTMTSGAKVG